MIPRFPLLLDNNVGGSSISFSSQTDAFQFEAHLQGKEEKYL